MTSRQQSITLKVLRSEVPILRAALLLLASYAEDADTRLLCGRLRRQIDRLAAGERAGEG